MNTDEADRLTEKIIGCAFAVSNGLGCGFLEYEQFLIGVHLRSSAVAD